MPLYSDSWVWSVLQIISCNRLVSSGNLLLGLLAILCITLNITALQCCLQTQITASQLFKLYLCMAHSLMGVYIAATFAVDLLYGCHVVRLAVSWNMSMRYKVLGVLHMILYTFYLLLSALITLDRFISIVLIFKRKHLTLITGWSINVLVSFLPAIFCILATLGIGLLLIIFLQYPHL